MGRGLMGCAAVLAVVVAMIPASTAGAAAPEFLLQIPPESIGSGSGAGEFNIPRGMATDPQNGHLYVADYVNTRVSEFTPWGAFVKAWGWDVAPDGAPGDTASDQFEICTLTCKAGVAGGGVGQFAELPRGVTVDGAGDVYVVDGTESLSGGNPSLRVQKFDPAGNFLLMFGGEVNEGPLHPGNLCTAQHITEGDTCGAGVPGTGDGEFSNGSLNNYIAYNPSTDTVFVGDVDRIQEFNLDGTFKGEIEFGGAFDGKTVRGLASDPASGDLYVSFTATADVYRVDPALGVLDELADLVADPLPVPVPVALAVDAAGSVYAVDEVPFPGNFSRVFGFDAAGEPIDGLEPEDEFANDGFALTINGLATLPACPNGTEPGLLYADFAGLGPARGYVKAYGQPPICFEDPPAVPPDVKASFAVSAGTEGAVVKAQINPRFWPDATYYVQYGTGECSAGGCGQEKPAPPGAVLTTKSINAVIATAGVSLTGLAPGTTYHFRFVAQSGGGGPVLGPEGSFTTFAEEDAPQACPGNAQFRTGPSKQLPDCRAYELVSPLAKNNADIVAPITLAGYPTAVNQSASSGERLAYSSGTAFDDPEGAPLISQYLAQRHPLGDPQQGWTSEPLASPRTLALVPGFFSDNEFKAFSEDLCSAWMRSEFDPPLAAGAAQGYRNLYRRDNCGGEGFTTLSVGTPPHVEKEVAGSYEGLQFLGAAADGRHSIFIAPDNLPGTEAPLNDKGRLQLYEHTADGQLRFVCILPNGNPTANACYGGTVDEAFGGRNRLGTFDNAISADGERIFWSERIPLTASEKNVFGPGKIFVKVAGEAASRRVSQSASGAKARFWGAASDGSKAIFAIEDSISPLDENLYTFDVEADAETLIAGEVKGVLGVSEDATRVYFASTKAIAAAGANSENDEAVAGKHNVYLFEEGEGAAADTYAFVGTLADAEVNQIARPFSVIPFFHTARVSPDGRHAAFMSTAPLTSYDNTDAVSGEADAEVFHYDAPEAELRCVSCNPTGVRPSGIDRRTISFPQGISKLWQAAQIPTLNRGYHATRPLSADGNRLFFESWEALAPRDTNDAADVYQWEAEGAGSCDAGDSGFVKDPAEASGGCIELISSGKSPRGSEFVDADPSGDNVFISTLSSLVPPDYGLVDVYDARAGGGFPYPEPPPPCEGEACQAPPPAPEYANPASASGEAPKLGKQPCPKGKRRVVRHGKVRCVKKKRKRKGQRGGRGRPTRAVR
jgi:DNA-binding beta-propeller fold protein YncE